MIEGSSSGDFERFILAGIEINVVRKDILRFDDAVRPVSFVDKLFEHLGGNQPIIPCDQKLVDAGGNEKVIHSGLRSNLLQNVGEQDQGRSIDSDVGSQGIETGF